MNITTDISQVQYLDMGQDLEGNPRKVAYVKHEGKTDAPGIFIVPGYFSDMNLPKTTAVEEFCKEYGLAFVKYDSEGTGISPGIHRNITYRTWVDDAVEAFDQLTTGPQILVASSMGGWTATILAVRRPERIHSIMHIGIGPVNQFKGSYSENMKDFVAAAPPAAQKRWDAGDIMEKESAWGVKVKYWKKFDEDVPDDIVPGATIPITCPVRLLHALEDDTVPYNVVFEYASRLESTDVDIILRKTGNHRLMKRADRKLILEVLQTLLTDYDITKKNGKLH